MVAVAEDAVLLPEELEVRMEFGQTQTQEWCTVRAVVVAEQVRIVGGIAVVMELLVARGVSRVRALVEASLQLLTRQHSSYFYW
jgi:hypothetical protein